MSKKMIAGFVLMTAGLTLNAQMPTEPPPGDMNPAHVSPKSSDPSGKKTKGVAPSIHPKRPPVLPPTPEKMAPDKTPTIQ